MKKKRFLKIICCFCLLLCSTFFLAACGENPVGGYESGSDAPAPDNTPPSTGDDSDVDIDDDGNIKSGEVADFSQYFSGYMVTLNESGDLLVKDDTLGVNKKVLFTALVDRQIDILSQDILNGLNYIYGNYRLTTTNVWGNSIVLNCLVIDAEGKPTDENSPYQYGELTAMTHTDKLLTQLSKSDYDSIYGNNEENKITATLTEININVLSDYQKSLLLNKTQNNNISTENNYFADVTALNLMGASSGQNMRLNKAARLVEDTDKVWKVSQLTTEETKNNLKLMIAQILTNDAGSDYDALISKIDKLGFDSTFNDKLIDVVNENIIGSDRIAEDDKYYKEINDKNIYNGKIDVEILADIYSKTKWLDSDKSEKKYTIDNNPRLYKGYKVVIPALVKRALRNTFEGDYQPKVMKNWKAKDKDGKEISYWGEDTSNWASTSLYPYFKKSSSANGNFSTYPIIKDGEVIQEMTTTGPIKLDKIILQPKANTQPVALQLQIATARDKHTGRTPTGIDDVTCYEHDIVVELEVDIMYKAGTYKKEMNSYVPDGESSSVLTIDSRGYVPTYIDTEDPNFDPSKVQFDPNNPNAKDPYSESFRKPYDTNGEVLPFNYIFSIYDKFDKDPATPKFGEYDGPTSINDMGTIVGNNYECTDGVNINLDTGNNYLQFTFRIKSIKQYSGDNDSELVDTNFTASDVVFDISLMPYTF